MPAAIRAPLQVSADFAIDLTEASNLLPYSSYLSMTRGASIACTDGETVFYSEGASHSCNFQQLRLADEVKRHTKSQTHKVQSIFGIKYDPIAAGPCLLAVMSGSKCYVLQQAAAGQPAVLTGVCSSVGEASWKHIAWHPSQKGLVALACPQEVSIYQCSTSQEEHAVEAPLEAARRATIRPTTASSLRTAPSIAWADGGEAILVSWPNETELLWLGGSRTEPGGAQAGSGNQPPGNINRHPVLLGIAGRVRSLESGPGGSVIGTFDAGLSLVASSMNQASQLADDAGDAEPANDVVDLRGAFSDGPQPVGVLDSLMGNGGGGPGVSVPSMFLLPDEPQASSSQAQLCVVWSDSSRRQKLPDKAAEAAGGEERPSCSVADGSSTAERHAGDHAALHGRLKPNGRGGASSLTSPLFLPSPDALSVHQGIAVTGSSSARAVVQFHSITASAGLEHICDLVLMGPGDDVQNCRLRGVALHIDPAARGAMLWALMVRTSRAQSFIGFSKSGPNKTPAPLFLQRYDVTAHLSQVMAAPPVVSSPSAVSPPADAGPQHSCMSPASAAPAVPNERQSAQQSFPPAAATAAAAPAPDNATSQLLSQISGLFSEFKSHVDQRLDRLEGSLQDHSQRLQQLERQ